MKVGLVLGAGGVVGASWLVGALEALVSETGWDPASADRIVGTSAGSVVGCLLAEGIPPEYMSAYIGGRTLDTVADMEQRGDALAAQDGGATFRLHRGLPRLGPGSLQMALSTMRRPLRHTGATLVAGWLPQGFVSTKPISDLVSTFVSSEWPDHPSFWAVAADYGSGRRIAFGRADAPPARAVDAVAASCAIPSFYHPVRIGDRRYVDGGICSPSNLDLLCGYDLDLVVCLNPMSSPAPLTGGSPGDRLGALLRGAAGRRLRREVEKLRKSGTEVLLIQPTARDLQVMGWNFMARGRRVEVVEMAVRTTALELRRLRGRRLMPPKSARRRVRRDLAALAPLGLADAAAA
jgi:NTE family protein